MQGTYRPVWLATVVALLLPVVGVGCGGSGNEAGGTPEASIKPPADDSSSFDPASPALDPGPVVVRPSESPESSPAPPQKDYYPEVIIKTTHGEIVLQLDPQVAPRTVDNFLREYVDRKFYEGTILHYVDDGYMIAGGGYTAEFEPKEPGAQIFNEAAGGMKNLAGTIAMARHPNARHSATCQFFINLADNSNLDHQDAESDEAYGYCVFGKVIRGMDVVEQIAKVPVEDREGFPRTPVEPIVVESIRQIK